ncbi:MAG: hypothetical protein LBG58_08210 [Planctomycetaceae bacterium]|jgi:hypothetical protein|nr:hypothetical protein [Planctomycetaceae bacterium]
MVSVYRLGFSLREVAAEFNVTKSTVQRWVRYASGKRLDRVDFSDPKSGTAVPPNKSTVGMEKRVLQLRKYLRDKSILGLYGAESIREEMLRRGESDVPTSRTITNILKRYGQIDRRVRQRRTAPPPGWYLPDLLKRKVELDSFDIVEKLYLTGGEEIQLFNGISIHGDLIHSSAMNTVTSENTILALIEHWKQFGLPKYVPFDNDMVFQGPRKARVIGKVIRLCLSLRVIPVFVTPYEQGFQGKIERFNEEIQAKFWRRKQFRNLNAVKKYLEQYVMAHRLRQQGNILAAPLRRLFPKRWKRDDTKRPQGKIIYLRRTDGNGEVYLLEQNFLISNDWINRLVRIEFDLNKGKLKFFALRRAEWKKQYLLKTISFQLIEN